MQKILLAVALVSGGLVTYIDTRPTWDDTGITAAAVFILSGVFGFLGPRRPCLWALAIGIWIPLFGILKTQNYWAILALVVAFAGAYSGMAIRKWLLPVPE
jgi:hypothetical protein